MKPIQEVFLEIAWDSEEAARQARDARAVELQTQGLVCVCENLYNVVNGRRVFLVIATEAEKLEPFDTQESNRIVPRSKGSERPSLPKRKRPETDAEIR